jgi:hypothetical protein
MMKRTVLACAPQLAEELCGLRGCQSGREPAMLFIETLDNAAFPVRWA